VARALVAVREATPDDLPDLLMLWRQHRDLAGRSERVLPDPTVAGALDLLRRAAQDAHTRIMLATVGDSVAGIAVLTHEPLAALFDTRVVHLHYLQVREGYRRRGVGHALVAAAASFAEQVGAEHVVSSVAPNLREGNRFFAQLGFAPVAVHRLASVPALRRRLAADRRHGALDELLSRRRSLRNRAQRTPAPPAGQAPPGAPAPEPAAPVEPAQSPSLVTGSD